MAKISVYYDYFEDGMKPLWMVIAFKKSEMQWDKRCLYVPINTPFKRKTAEDFSELRMGFTITLVDLMMNCDKENCFGIKIDSLKMRLNMLRGRGEFPYDVEEIEEFVIQMSDIEDVLAMDINDLYAWR